MNLLEACQSAREGNFVSHHSFDYYESMHEFNGDLYYEDGANITRFIKAMEKEEWSREGWFIKYSKDMIDKDKLIKMHEENRGKMLYDESYEDCLI